MARRGRAAGKSVKKRDAPQKKRDLEIRKRRKA
jgi:hypothetical protein